MHESYPRLWRAELFIVTVVIAWTYLLHAWCKPEGDDHWHTRTEKGEKVVVKTPTGADKYRELAQCIGVLAGYAPPKHRYWRAGIRPDPDPNAVLRQRFVEELGTDGYSEGWADELQVFHNPRALRPLPKECFGPLNQHCFEDGQMVTYCGASAVLSSFTMIMQVTDGDEMNGKAARS